jgi:hypothetical protein
VRKNSPPFEPIRCWEKLREIERKLPVVLVKPEGHRRSPTPSVEFMRRTPSSHTVHTGRRPTKVS